MAYQTAYLKANYPAQYMAGVMSRSLADIKTITKLMDESKSMGISTLGPDINESRVKFSVNALGEIRFGLGAVKGVGEAAVDAILSERKKTAPTSRSTTSSRESISLPAIRNALNLWPSPVPSTGSVPSVANNSSPPAKR